MATMAEQDREVGRERGREWRKNADPKQVETLERRAGEAEDSGGLFAGRPDHKGWIGVVSWACREEDLSDFIFREEDDFDAEDLDVLEGFVEGALEEPKEAAGEAVN